MSIHTLTPPSQPNDPSVDWPPLQVEHRLNGAVHVTSQDHPQFANGDLIGIASTTGAPVWIDMDGNGGCSDTYEQAVEELVTAAVDYARRRWEADR